MIATGLRIARSFGFAAAGLRHLFRTQPNALVHLAAAVVVVGLSVWLDVQGVELAVLALAIGLVLVAETLNTAIESVVDLASPSLHPLARAAKDSAAAAVLLAALTALAIGVIVLLPKLLARLPV